MALDEDDQADNDTAQAAQSQRDAADAHEEKASEIEAG